MWEEREIVGYLRDYHSSPELNHQEKIDAIKDGVERQDFFLYISKKKYKHEIREILENNREEWKRIRYVVDECIEDGYLRQEIEKIKGPFGDEILKGQYLFLTSKGKKLLRGYYFYLKYLPEEFSDLKIILFAIVGTILTSPIWRPIISRIGSYFNFVISRLRF